MDTKLLITIVLAIVIGSFVSNMLDKHVLNRLDEVDMIDASFDEYEDEE